MRSCDIDKPQGIASQHGGTAENPVVQGPSAPLTYRTRGVFFESVQVEDRERSQF